MEGRISHLYLNLNTDICLPGLLKPSITGKFFARTNDYVKVDYNIPIEISKQLLLFAYADVREFNQSVYKRTYLSEKYDLLSNGYVDWINNRIEEIGRVEIYSSILKTIFCLQINSAWKMATVSMLSFKSSTEEANIPCLVRQTLS